MKKKTDQWKDLRETWDCRPGPDPRWRIEGIQVIWRFAHTSLDKWERTQHDEQHYQAKTLEDARKKFEHVVTKVAGVKEIDVKLHLVLGGFFRTSFVAPYTSEVNIYLIRWREDGAFPESYHFNEVRFAERKLDEGHHELGGGRSFPGLMKYWKDKEEEREAKEAALKKQKK